MNATSLLEKITNALIESRLEAILIGNAAAALHGAPVTTLDFDFFFRKTPANLRKLKVVANNLGGIILRPYYPLSDLYRIVNDDLGLQLDFMSTIHGVRSFAGLRSRSHRVTLGQNDLLVADLGDIIKSKEALSRPRDLAVLDILKKTLNETKKITRIPLSKSSRRSPRKRK